MVKKESWIRTFFTHGGIPITYAIIVALASFIVGQTITHIKIQSELIRANEIFASLQIDVDKLEERIITKDEFNAFVVRLDRIEDKLDRLIEK